MTAAVAGAATKAAGAAKGAVSAAAKGAKSTGGAASSAAKSTGARTSQAARAGASTSAADKQRAGIQAIKDRRPVTDNAVSAAAGVEPTPPAEDTTTSRPALADNAAVTGGVKAANTGGGFLLGVATWVLVRTYLDSGAAGVKRLLRAKFFNQVDG